MLLAPNGKQSNLTDSQYKLVRTPAFKKWFGDWENNPSEASKVVDENGEPLVVYHGTTFDFTIFKKDKPTVGAYGQGFYFTNDKGFASNYARGNNAKFLNCFLNIKKIFTINNDELPNGYEKYLGMADNKGVSRDFTRKIIYENYDGVYAINKYNENELIVFEPNQIKLADGTNTTFDSNNPDIRYNDGGSIPKELYHYTSETNFDRIFDSNILNPSQKYGNRLSFTSDSEYHKKEHGLDYGNTNVRITFDNEKLISDGYSFSQFDHSSKQNKIGKEFEYIISIPIKNVKKYIKSITFFKGNAIVGEIDKTTTDYANKYYLNPDISDGGRIKPIKKSILNNFQSGSSLDFYDNKIFVVGDDTRDLLILNKNFEELNRVRLFESEDRRIAKDLKADLETSTIIEYNGSPSMLMLGSGSKDNKSFGYIINLDTLEVTEKFKYDIFINRLKDEYGIADVNIEGSACVSDYFLLSNRGNKTNPDNLLIVTENNFWEKQSRVNISLSRILLPNKDAGVSEIYYEIDSDTLFFTASIEHTANNYDDGKIGDSFIGYILNFSSKLYKDTVTPDLFINLTEVDSSFNKQKIEGICIEDNTGGNYVINLVSDNDNDESIIFKIELKKPVRGGSLNSFQQLANRYNGK